MSLKLRNLKLQLSISKTLYISLRQCDLCDADYINVWRNTNDRYNVIGNDVREQHGNEPREITKNFRISRKWSNKFDCLIFEMFFIRDLKPKLNKQSDSIRAKLFAK